MASKPQGLPANFYSTAETRSVFQLLQTADLADPEAGELALPAVERGLRDPQLAADVDHRRPRLRLPERHPDLLFSEPFPGHPSRLLPWREPTRKVALGLDQDLGSGPVTPKESRMRQTRRPSKPR